MNTRRIIIFGNSGSGKSTLARQLSIEHSLAHLDLDNLAWSDTLPPSRKSLVESTALIDQFLQLHNKWVIEGCYSDLLSIVSEHADELIFLNPGITTCTTNCKNRPWEPHKYKTLSEQNENLEMLLNWVAQYALREDEFSLSSHLQLYNDFEGKKIEYKSNKR